GHAQSPHLRPPAAGLLASSEAELAKAHARHRLPQPRHRRGQAAPGDHEVRAPRTIRQDAPRAPRGPTWACADDPPPLREGALMRITRTVTVLGSLIAIAAPAAAAVTPTGASDLEPVENPAPRAGVDEALTRIVLGTLGASIGSAAVVASSFGGYDSAAKAPIASLYTEVKVLPRLVLLAGAAWAVPNALGQGGGDMRPQLGARVQLLNQAKYGLDMAAGFMFREDK